MQYINHTTYDKRALTALNYFAGKTIQKKKTAISRTFCIVMGILGLAAGLTLLFLAHEKQTLAALALLYGVLFLGVGLFWTQFQTWSSKRMMMQNVKHCTFVFDEEGVSMENEVETTHYLYRRLRTVAENKDWYVFFMDAQHGFALDKAGFDSVNLKAFSRFLEEKLKHEIITLDDTVKNKPKESRYKEKKR
ncbi:MAG: YcxB family protein [Evtepia sp.]